MKKQIVNSFLVKLLCVVAVIVVLQSCTDKFEDYNTDKSVLMSVGTKELAGLMSNSQMSV